MRTIRKKCAIAAAVVPVSLAIAQPYAFTLDPNQSDVVIDATISATAAGTLIGDFDPETNPEGTQTRPGIFGGSGNNPINTSLDLSIELTALSVPEGDFSAAFGALGLGAAISGLTFDALPATSLSLDLVLTLAYQTFRTVNPGFLYIGGFDLPIPLANADLTDLTFTQTGPADFPSGLVPDGEGGFTLVGAVPVAVRVAGDIGGLVLPASQFDETFEIALPITASLTFSGTTAVFMFEFTLDEITSEFDLSEIPPIENIPLPLPTLSGDTANVLLSFIADQLATSGAGAFVVVANGRCLYDTNADDEVNVADLLAFLTAAANNDPAADITFDGQINIFDLLSFVAGFRSGCRG